MQSLGSCRVTVITRPPACDKAAGRREIVVTRQEPSDCGVLYNPISSPRVIARNEAIPNKQSRSV